MTETTLTPERILVAAEDVLRRFGPAKTTVVDVARELGVSHGSVYRHFPSKAALRDAVTERWLQRVAVPLAAISAAEGPAPERLRQWFSELVATKQRWAAEDPALFATYLAIAAEAREVIKAHVETMISQIAHILAAGVAQGEFVALDPAAVGRALFDATARFHDPAQAATWGDPEIGTAFDRVWSLLMRAITSDQ